MLLASSLTWINARLDLQVKPVRPLAGLSDRMRRVKPEAELHDLAAAGDPVPVYPALLAAREHLDGERNGFCVHQLSSREIIDKCRS